MNQIKHILKKEFSAYFISPIAYIVIAIFLLVTGWFFFMAFFLYGQASMRDFFRLLPITFAFVIPAVTMRLFAEELNVGSYETLLTLPVTPAQVLVGKFLASVLFITVMLVPTIAYPIFISFMGQLDWGPVIGGYIGSILLGALFCGVGVFSSILTRNQIIAFIIGMAICFSLTLVNRMLFFIPQSVVGIFEYFGAGSHFQTISKGIIDTRDLLYFFSGIFISLYSAHFVMLKKN